MDIEKCFQEITSPEISDIISEGLSQIYKVKPAFPVTYLADWLNSFSSFQKKKKQLIANKKLNLERYNQIQTIKKKLREQELQQFQKHQKELELNEQQYQSKIIQTVHLEDLLESWLPQYIEKNFELTGAYVGKLDYNKKPIQQGNFQPGAENDTENPKSIFYIGASHSHKSLMAKAVLSNGKGISYSVFQQKSEENIEQQQINKLPPKKTYIYIENVLKQQNIHYFKYPRLGAYACFPLKIESCLSIPILDKGIADYKTYLKTKQQTEKQHNERLTEAKSEFEEAFKKFQDFQINEQDLSTVEQKKNLQAEVKIAEQKYQQILKSPPVIEEVKFDTIQRDFFIAGDTLGQDKQISEKNLQKINNKIQFFIDRWEQKQKKMLLKDILTFLEDEPQLQTLQHILNEHEKNIVTTYEPQIKQQFLNKQKEAEFQISLIKCEKMCQLLKEPNFSKSIQTYLNYNVPKFTELIQILCMLIGLPKQEINSRETNQLNFRKMISQQSFQSLLLKLEKYQLRRESSQNVPSEYKINKLLQRLDKIDSQSLSKYNGFLYILHHLLKTYCWTRILCRDAKKQLFELKTRQKEERDAEIQKWSAEIQKSLETAKSELDEEGLQNFNEQDWRRTYETQNPKPQALEAPLHQEFLDIQ